VMSSEAAEGAGLVSESQKHSSSEGCETDRSAALTHHCHHSFVLHT
jgi:hypothetical protein